MALLRIHVERAIRMKHFTIFKVIFLINMARTANQTVCVSAWLTNNYFPPLVPPPTDKETDSSSDEDSDYMQ
jgi:hypothetical protein